MVTNLSTNSYWQDLKVNFKKEWFKLPNILTELRLLLSPVPGVLLVFGPKNLSFRIITLIIFVVIALTDLLDGFLARNYHQTSDFGKILDPIADTFLSGLTIIALSIVNPMAIPLAIITTIRQLDLALLSYFNKKLGKNVNVVFSGKVKTALGIIATALLFFQTEGWLRWGTWVVVILAIISSFVSWVEYRKRYSGTCN